MLHLFVINSHTTFLTAMGVVDFLNLSNKNVVFLYMRHYKNSIINVSYKQFDVSVIEDKYSLSEVWRIKKIRDDYINDIDAYINAIVVGKFILYAPHYSHPLFQVLYTHEKCEYGNYIQEGAIPFKNAYILRQSLFKRLVNSIINKFWLRTNRIWMPHGWYVSGKLYKNIDGLESYAVDNLFFKYLPSHNNVVSWPNLTIQKIIEDESTIFIFDGFVQNNYVEREIYINKCELMINIESGMINYLKFHPAQPTKDRDEICSFFDKRSLKYYILDDNVPFELIIQSSNTYKLVGMGSSLLFLAKRYNHNVICYDRLLSKSKLYNSYKAYYGFPFFDELYGE